MKRLTVDVSDEFHHQVKVKATQEGMTISDVMRELLQRWLEEEEKEKPPPE
jgi:Arc/MetJ-type ribon-helix-helix transcriptional regulator